MVLLRKFLLISLIFIGLCSCSNQFAYKPNNWQLVTTTQDSSKSVYIDSNQLNCEGSKCRAWTKVLFGEVESIGYTAKKPGEQSGNLMVKRIDSSVEYDCASKTAMIISYQLYDNDDKLIDSKWIKGDIEYASPGTVHGDVLRYVCKGYKQENDEEKQEK